MNKDGEHAMLNLRCESQRHNNDVVSQRLIDWCPTPTPSSISAISWPDQMLSHSVWLIGDQRQQQSPLVLTEHKKDHDVCYTQMWPISMGIPVTEIVLYTSVSYVDLNLL
jgi:hypothetical protein